MKPNDKAEALHQRAYGLLMATMDNRGVKLGEDHRVALGRIIGDMARQAYGLHPGRHGYGLPTGGGKSTAVACVIVAAHELDPSLTMAVASARIDNLKEIFQSVNEMAGYAQNGDVLPGLEVLHSDKTRTDFRPTANPVGARYLLTTHEELRGGERKLGRHGYVTGGRDEGFALRKRDLFVYDEGFTAALGL